MHHHLREKARLKTRYSLFLCTPLYPMLHDSSRDCHHFLFFLEQGRRSKKNSLRCILLMHGRAPNLRLQICHLHDTFFVTTVRPYHPHAHSANLSAPLMDKRQSSNPLYRIGVITVSDRASVGQYVDRSGPAILAYLAEHLQPDYCTECVVIPDEQATIQSAIIRLVETCCLVLTTGGTGPAPRDVTPEATEAVCQKILPGFGERMRAVSVEKVPTAILSRQTAGICSQSLVVNLPGSPKSIAECLDPILPAIPHAIRLAGNSQKVSLKPQYHMKGKMCKECNVEH